jgi:RecA-family ATPase
MTDMTSGTTGSYVARVVTNEAVEISAAIGEEIASWRRVFAARNPDVDARQLLQNATRELWTVLQIDRTAHPESEVVTRQEAIDALQEMAQGAGISDNDAQAIFAECFRKQPAQAAEIYDIQIGAAVRPDEAHAPVKWLDMSNWDSEPVPEREWSIKDRVPLNQAGLFSGEGGTGKSIIELMKNVAHVAGKDWLGSMPEPGPAFYIGAEDDEKEIHIRLAAIAKHHGVSFEDLIEDGLRVLCLLGEDATLCAASNKSGRLEVTSLYKRLYEAAGDIKPKNISIDTLSRAFAGNEIDRVQVYAFAMHMQKLAMVAGGSVTVLSHPSLAGISSGSGISGSTAWHGAFRFRQYLKGVKADAGEQPDADLRELEFKKNQYGPTGETIVLRYQRGLFLPEGGLSNLDALTRQQKIEEAFLAILARYEREGRNASDKTTSHNYGPSAFCREPEGKGIRKEHFVAAMRRLFARGKLHVENYGRPSRPLSRLKLGRKGDSRDG